MFSRLTTKVRSQFAGASDRSKLAATTPKNKNWNKSLTSPSNNTRSKEGITSYDNYLTSTYGD